MRSSLSQVAVVVVVAVLAVTGTGIATIPAGPLATNPVPAQQSGEDCSFPATVTDASGTDVTLDEEPDRIVVLAPSDAQTLWAIGAREKVVGMPVDQYTSYLNGTQGKTDVTNDDGSVGTERVVGLQPDIVFAASVTPNETVNQLRQAGITVFQTSLATSIEDVYGVTERYGRLAGECAGASETVSQMQTRVSEIEEAVGESDEPSALYYFFNFTAGTDTHINDVVETAGARSVAAEAGISGYKPVNAEIVASQNPEWIIHPTSSPVPEGQPYSGTTALEENQTVALEDNLIQQPGPRIVIVLTRLARALHPEAMDSTTLTPVDFSASSAPGANATNAGGTSGAQNTSANASAGTSTESPTAADGGNATATTTAAGGGGTETATATGTGSGTTAGTGTGTQTTTEASGPGFGLVGAVLALLATALLARYRH